MSASELAELEAFLVKVLPDPMGFVERVMGGRLANAPPTVEAPIVVPGYEVADREALVDHNVLLAGALGACDCWGQDADCRICSGQGSSGWVEPNTALYDEYVAPAVRQVQAGDAMPGSKAAPRSDPEPTDEAPADQMTVGGRA